MKTQFSFLISTIIIVCSLLLMTRSVVKGQMLDRSNTRVQTTLNIDWKKLGTIRPRHVTEFTTDDNWTIGCETLDRDYIYWDTYKDYLAPLGIRRIRLQAGWAKTEREKGKYDFSWLDTIINDARNRGLIIWLETDYGNPIYEGGGGRDLAGGFPTSPEALTAWDKWVEALAVRYQDKVWAWAMWNEPDIGGAKTEPKKTPKQIADFNIRTAEIIKKVIPDAKIAGLSLSSIDPVFLKSCLDCIAEKKKIGLFTWVIYHGYTMIPDSAYTSVEKMKKVVQQYNPPLTLWQGENGCPSERVVNLALSNYNWTELTQAKWNARRMLGDLGHDVMSNVFCICDYYHPGRDTARFGLLKTNDHRHLAKVKMAYYTVQNIVSLFDGTLQRDKNYQYKIEAPEKVTWFAYCDSGNKQMVFVYWDGNNIPSDENSITPITVELPTESFAQPVWVDLITGSIYAIPDKEIKRKNGKLIISNLPCYDAPTALVEQSRLLH